MLVCNINYKDVSELVKVYKLLGFSKLSNPLKYRLGFS